MADDQIPASPTPAGDPLPATPAGDYLPATPAPAQAPDFSAIPGHQAHSNPVPGVSAEQYVKNLETQQAGEKEYSDFLYKNSPDEYRKADPMGYFARKVHGVISEAAARGIEHDPEYLKQAVAPHVQALADFVSGQLGVSPGSVGKTEGLAAAPLMPEGSLGGIEDAASVQRVPEGAEVPANLKSANPKLKNGLAAAPDSMGRNGGSFGNAVDSSYEVGRKYAADNATREDMKKDPEVLWHGSPSGDWRGSARGLHVGTHEAATQALEARIGVPAQGEWDGTREYGKTLLAGQKTLRALEPEKFKRSGYNATSPEEDHYPTGTATYSDGTPVAMDAKPSIDPVRVKGAMTNNRWHPLSDFKANASMKAQVTKGSAKKGYYYKNQGEDFGSISAVVPNADHLEKLTPADTKNATANPKLKNALPAHSEGGQALDFSQVHGHEEIAPPKPEVPPEHAAYEIQRLEGVLRSPNLSRAEHKIATRQLADYREMFGMPAAEGSLGAVTGPEVKPASETPEWQKQEVDTEIQRLEEVLRDPHVSEEERRVATDQLASYRGTAPQGEVAEPDLGDVTFDKPAETSPEGGQKLDPRAAVEAAGGTYHGKNSDGLVEITLPRSMTEAIPGLQGRFKDFVSVTMPESEVTSEAVKREMDRKFLEMGGSRKAAGGVAPIRAYHGTAAAKDFKEFETEGRPYAEDEYGESHPTTSGSGPDPTAYMGAHFAKEPHVASKFATKSEGWLRTRYDEGDGEEGSAGPRVIPVDLHFKNPKDFGSETKMREFINHGDLSRAGYAGNNLLNRAMEADGIEAPDEGGEEVDKWMEKYQNDPEFRADQNKWIFESYRPEEGEEDDMHEAAQHLGSEAKNRLIEMGHDGAVYKNEVEGGTGYVAFTPRQIKSPFQAPAEISPEGGQEAKTPNGNISESQQAATSESAHTGTYHSDLQKVADIHKVTDDPYKTSHGSSFITPDGQYVHLPTGTSHADAIDAVKGKPGQEGLSTHSRKMFQNETGAVKTQVTFDPATGHTLKVTVPDSGVNTKQAQALIRAAQAALGGGKKGKVVLETANRKQTTEKVDAKPEDIEYMLHKIGAHPNSPAKTTQKATTRAKP